MSDSDSDRNGNTIYKMQQIDYVRNSDNSSINKNNNFNPTWMHFPRNCTFSYNTHYENEYLCFSDSLNNLNVWSF